MQIISTHKANFDHAVHVAANALAAGQIIAFPTETTYGIAVSMSYEDADFRLRSAKKRSENIPFQRLVGGMNHSICFPRTSEEARIMAQFWPGPLTLVLQNGVGVRCPDSDFLRAVIQAHGHPLAATSANMHGSDPVNTAEEAAGLFPNAVVFSDPIPVSGIASTVAQIKDGSVTIFREGAITKSQLIDASIQKSSCEFEFVIGSDHAGFIVKETLKSMLQAFGISVIDKGVFSAEPTDYTDIACKVIKDVLSDHKRQGILVCGTGLGMSYIANRYQNIRAALCWSEETAYFARNHNNASILILPGRVRTLNAPEAILRTWLNTSFSNEHRHITRIEKIERIHTDV